MTYVCMFIMSYCTYTVWLQAQSFGGRKLWWIAAVNKHFGGQNIDRLTALHSKLTRIKIVGR